MCIISDKISKSKDFGNSKISLFLWNESSNIDLSGFEIVVLDQEISNSYKVNFSLMKERIDLLLDSSGIVICLTFNTLKIENFTVNAFYTNDKMGILRSNPSGLSRYELSYDWLKENISAELGLLTLSIGTIDRKGIILPKIEPFKSYFDYVNVCHKTLNNTTNIAKNKDFRTLSLGKDAREGLPIEVLYIAEVKSTKKPVAAGIKVGNGVVIFLPQPNNRGLEIITKLYEIGQLAYQNIQEERVILEERPEWINSYILPDEREIQEERDQLTERLEQLKEQQSYYRKIDRLLFTKGKQLEDALEAFFKDFNFEYERTEKHESYDFILSNIVDSGRIFIEVSGEKSIKQGSRKMGQIMSTILQIDDTKDYIVLILNCEKEINPSERQVDKMFSPQARTILNNNKITVIQTLELYTLWKKTKNNEIASEDLIGWFKNKVESREDI